MALTLPTDAHLTGTTLDEYLDHIDKDVDLRDRDAVLASAGALASLARNPFVMVDYLNGELSACDDLNLFQKFNDYGATTFVLGRGPGWAVRANLWLPPEGDSMQRMSTHKLGVYQVPHDHDFSFLTVGYWGPGYSTSIFEYDRESFSGIVGSKVDLQFLEHTTLTEGKVMFYRASRDVHTQEYPMGPSISINLLLIPERPSTQYLFDTDSGVVSGVLANRAENGVGLCTLARYLGDESTAHRLDNIAMDHPDPRVRWAAFDSVAALVPEAAEEAMVRASRDTNEMVRRLSRARLSTGGTAPQFTRSTATPTVQADDAN